MMDELNPYEFDQTPTGWRYLDSQGKFLEAARAIEKYIVNHSEEIQAQARVSIQTMYFHAGQEYAMAGTKYYKQALNNFKKSYKSKVGWDTYVDGTIAFLNGDRIGLQIAVDNLTKEAQKDTDHSANSHLLHEFLNALSTHNNYATVYNKWLKTV